MPTLGDLLLGRPSGSLLDLMQQYGASVKQRGSLLASDPAEFTRQGLLDVVPNRAEAQAARARVMGGSLDPQAYSGYLGKMQDLGGLLGSLQVAKPPFEITHEVAQREGSLLPEAKVDTRLSDQWFAARAKKAQRNATAPVGRAGLGLSPRNTPEQRMKSMGLERDWYRGGEAPVTTRETPATGQWYTRSSDEAAGYASRAATPDVREYAIPSKMLDLMERQPPEVARKIGEQLMTSGDPAVLRFAQQYIDAAQAGESLDGRALFQGLHNTFGMDVAADAIRKAGFSGVRNWNTTGDAFVFPGQTIRDANRAAFDPALRARNDIYGAADPSLLGLLGAGGTLGALYAHSRREK